MGFIAKALNYKANTWDIGLIKVAVFAATLLIAKLLPDILSLEWYWYLIVWITAAIKPFYALVNRK